MDSVIHTIDSHTAGEPTRVVIGGGPDLRAGPLAQQRTQFKDEFDHFRTAIVTEPRGSAVLVGALLCSSADSTCEAGVIFFNNVGYLGMCGHGMIGVVETLRSLGRIGIGECRIETPVGVVVAYAHENGSVSLRNVESYRIAKDVSIEVEGLGNVVGDVAYGGNWFFLANEPCHRVSIQRVSDLTRYAVSIRNAINANGFPQVDHIELFGDATHADADSRNFVLCPGLEYDRSPCGTGTSAKLACLAADGKLAPQTNWIQEGILGTSFVGQYDWSHGSKHRIQPTITGKAFVTAESHLKIFSNDPFRWGIPCGDQIDE